MHRLSLAWVLVAASACGLAGLSACGGGDGADDGFAGGGGATDSGGTASGGVNAGGDLVSGGVSAGGTTSSAGASTGGSVTGGAGEGGVGEGGAAAGGTAAGGPANGGAADVAGANNAGAPGVVDCGGTCPNGRSVCDPATATCVECLTDGDCKDPSKPGCLLSTHRCEDCSKSAQCPQDKPTCDVQKGQCK